MFVAVLTLNDNILGELLPRKVKLLIATENVLQRSRTPEVLLLEAELLSGVHVVVGVEDTGLYCQLGGRQHDLQCSRHWSCSGSMPRSYRR